jgi:Uma2 family endonuclease
MNADERRSVSVDEYLNTAYRPDVEYVDGVLVERGLPTLLQGILQMILVQYFAQFQENMHFRALPEVRTQIIEGARYRIPDVLLCPRPVPRGKVVNITPLAVIEILSPDDRMGQTLERFRDYARIDVGNIVQMDPEKCVAHRFESGSPIETRFENLTAGDINVPFDSEALFAKLRAEYED